MADRPASGRQQEIDAFAGKLIRQYGPRAADHAAVAIVLMIDRGDLEGVGIWRQIHGAIVRIAGASPSKAEPRADLGFRSRLEPTAPPARPIVWLGGRYFSSPMLRRQPR